MRSVVNCRYWGLFFVFLFLASTLISCNKEVTVPDVRGMSESAAAAAIEDAGLAVGTPGEEYSSTVPVGQVIRQNPAAGASVAPDTAVTFVLSMGPQPVDVPDVVGMTEEAAQTALEDAGLALGTPDYPYSDTIPAGEVISQDPVAGTSVAPGTAVALTVSAGPEPVPVPDVVNMTQSAAQSAIEAAGLTATITLAYSDTVPNGIVISQNPPAGTSVAPGSAVSFEVSKGPEPVDVPDVVGMTEADAQAAIENAGLIVGNVDHAYSDTVPDGQVSSQDPASDRTALPGTPVKLVVSDGPEPVNVPNVVGMTESEAQTAIDAVGVTVGTVDYAFSDTVAKDHVISQNPVADTSVLPGTAVALVVSKGPDLVTVPDVVGMTESAAQTALTAERLQASVTRVYSDTVPEGEVISQDPAAGASVAPNTTVRIVVSKGKQPEPVTIDVLSVTPPEAVPGQVIKVNTTPPHAGTQYKVMFGDFCLSPMQVDESFLTVMVPLLEPGETSLSVVTDDTKAAGLSGVVTILPPVSINGQEAANLIADINELMSITKEYVLLDYQALGGPPDASLVLEQGLDNCMLVMAQVQQEINSLSLEDREILCQLIKGANLGHSVSENLKALKRTPLDKYNIILAQEKTGGSMGDSEFFFAATRLDLLSAVLTDVRSAMKGIKYLSLLANFVPALGQFVSLGAWGSLTAAEQPLKIVDGIIDGVLPTDLKQVHLEVVPQTGALLNPGELASVQLLGTFASQKPWTEVAMDFALDFTIDAVLHGLQDETRHFLDDLPGMDVDLRTKYAKDLLDSVATTFKDVGFNLADNLVDMPWEDVTAQGGFAWWKYDVPLNADYYYFEPIMQLQNSFAGLVPFWGDELTMALQNVMLDVLGEDSLLTNKAITVDDESIVSEFDRATGTIVAQKVGTTRMHAHAYRFDQVVDLLWLFPIEGWKHLEEGERLITPDGLSVSVNQPLEVTVTDAADPVSSDFVDSRVSGCIPGLFTTDGGTFELSVSPLDAEGNLLFENIGIENFSFAPIQVVDLMAPEMPVASGMATPDSVEAILPGELGSGVNVAILLDSSGSMGWNDPTEQRVLAAKALVDILRPEDQAAVFDFGSYNHTSGFSVTRLLQDFTSDHALLYQAIDQVQADNGTPMYESLEETIAFIGNSGLPNLALLVLTDGEAHDEYLFPNVVSQAQGIGLPLFVVGLGTGVDFTQLQALAAQTGGTFASAGDAAGLQMLFANLGVAVSAGRLVVHASGVFVPALQYPGQYKVFGELRTKISGLTIPTPFDFVVEVVSVGDGYVLKMLTNY